MTDQSDVQSRVMRPIPDRTPPGLTTYDAKDPDTAYPPIEPLLPPPGAPNVLVILLVAGSDDHDHFIDPDERLRIAMAQQ